MIPIKKQKALKQTNRKIILNIFRNSGEISVSDLAKEVSLSKPTLITIINYYLKKDMVVNAGKGCSTEEGGKKPNIYKFNENGGFAIGMIISANKLSGVITNLKIKILYRELMSLETDEKFESVLDKIINLYEDLVIKSRIDREKIIGLAVGAYGITNIDKGEVIFSPHFPSWGKNLNLKEKIARNIKDDIPVIVDNHSRFQVFAEKVLGLGKGKNNIVAVQAGKGLVAGVIIENEIKRGNHYLIGEVGHMVVDPEAREICVCGGKGCFEAMVTTNRMIRLAKQKYADYPDSIIFNGAGPDNVDIDRIFDASNKGDSLALYLMDDVINWFGIGISNIILVYDPQIVIIQGIFTRAGNYFIKSLRERINRVSLFSIKRETEIKYSKLGENVGVLGAAAYVLSKYFE
jgi:predicted NBD/HSP70 family sugar kinase